MPSLTARIYMPDGNASGPLYVHSRAVADLMVVRLPPDMPPSQMPVSVAGRSGLLITMEDGIPRVETTSTFLTLTDALDCAVVAHPGKVFRLAEETMPHFTQDYLSALGSALAARLGGRFHDTFRTGTPSEQSAAQAATDAPALAEMLDAVARNQFRINAELPDVPAPRTGP